MSRRRIWLAMVVLGVSSLWALTLSGPGGWNSFSVRLAAAESLAESLPKAGWPRGQLPHVRATAVAVE